MSPSPTRKLLRYRVHPLNGIFIEGKLCHGRDWALWRYFGFHQLGSAVGFETGAVTVGHASLTTPIRGLFQPQPELNELL